MSGRTIVLTPQELLGHKCRAYADGMKAALTSVVESLQLASAMPEVQSATGPEVADQLAEGMRELAPILLADLRRTMAEKAGVEL